MDIRQIISKLKASEQLTDEERESFANFDLDSIYADARRDAERKIKSANEQLEKLRLQLETAKAEKSENTDVVEKLKSQIAELGKKIEARDKAAAQAARFARLDEELSKRGIAAAKGTGHALRDAWRARTDNIADLDDKAALDDAAKMLREELPGLVSDNGLRVPSTHGGSNPFSGNPFDPKSSNLTQALEILQNNPALAAQMQRDAGIT